MKNVEVKYVVVCNDKKDLKCEVPIDDLLVLHEMGFRFKKHGCVYESHNGLTLRRSCTETDFLSGYIGTYLNIAHDLYVDIYKSYGSDMLCVNSMKYLSKLVDVNVAMKDFLSRELQEFFMNMEVLYSNPLDTLQELLETNKIKLKVNNVSLLSTVNVVGLGSCNLYKFISNLKYYTYKE